MSTGLKTAPSDTQSRSEQSESKAELLERDNGVLHWGGAGFFKTRLTLFRLLLEADFRMIAGRHECLVLIEEQLRLVVVIVVVGAVDEL